MKLLLIFPKWTGNYGIMGYFARRASTWQPLNLAILGAVAEKSGCNVRIVDGEAEDVSHDKMLDIIKEFDPDIIGLTGTTPFYHLSVDMAKKIKEKFSIPIIIGGTHITIEQERAFDKCFDYAFLGEAEVTLVNFINWFKKARDYPSFKGIMFRKNGIVINNGMADSVQHLDSLPFPARHLLKMDRYKMGTPNGLKRFSTIMATRGCPFDCIFCSSKVFGKKVRRKSVDYVLEEIRQVIHQFGIRHFIFLDDTLTLDREYIIDICLRLIPFNITFSGSTRANLVDEELIQVMKQAGLIRISFGLETVDEGIRKIIRKNVPIEAYKEANRITNRHGIETLNSIMLGLPNETKETFEKTMKFLDESKEIKQANLAIATPYVGTELYEMAKRGDYGLRILSYDYSKYKRYGSAVMESDKLSAQDLLDMQNEGFARIYSARWRIIPMIKKSGIIGALITFLRIIKVRLK